MSFLSSFRSAASTTRSHKNKTVSNKRMSTIEEDSPYSPTYDPPSFNSQLHLIPAPNIRFEAPPPPYLFPNLELRADEGKEGNQVRSTPGTSRRAVLFAVSVLCLIGLVLGLVLGLTMRRKHSDPKEDVPNSSAPAVPYSITAFPAGNFTIDTVLTTISTSCTSMQPTWRCFPYTTLSLSNSSAAAATFVWTIDEDASGNYIISAASNSTFAPAFTSIPLTLHNHTLSTEYYYFSFNTTKTVIPSTSITLNNTAATCYYNSTTFEATLYTKMGKLYPSSTQNSTSNSQNWPYAVEVKEVAAGGSDVPNCYDDQGESIGSFAPENIYQDCDCIYNN